MPSQTIDLTPSWEQITPVLVHILTKSSNAESREFALSELLRMARFADSEIHRMARLADALTADPLIH
jgi:hypothetical protein